MGIKRTSEDLKKSAAKAVIALQGLPVYTGLRKLFSPKIHIQEASASDWRQVHEILNPGSSEPPPPPGVQSTDFVAKRGDKVIGHVQLVQAPERFDLPAGWWLFSLGVRLKFRRMGVGEQLALQVLEAAHERGAPDLYLLVYEDNLPAVRLYEKLGFEQRIFPEMEVELEKERSRFGRRRIVMVSSLPAAKELGIQG
jgi:ribosomal protein S18 acetylase RimI-like enzyme